MPRPRTRPYLHVMVCARQAVIMIPRLGFDNMSLHYIYQGPRQNRDHHTIQLLQQDDQSHDPSIPYIHTSHMNITPLVKVKSNRN